MAGKKWVAGIIAVILAGAALFAFWLYPSGESMQESTPYRPVPIDPNEQHTIVFWDVQYPMQHPGYEHFIRAAVAAFNKEFPNVHIESRLFDWQDASEMENGFLAKERVDVIGTVWRDDWPMEHTVPVKPFLKPTTNDIPAEHEEYITSAWPETSENGVWNVWPRWLAPAYWIGNRATAEREGITVPWHDWQRDGWSIVEAEALGIDARLTIAWDDAERSETATRLLQGTQRQADPWVLAGALDPAWARRAVDLPGAVLLPPPDDVPTKVQISGFAVIDHDQYRNARHVQAAVEWARFLSKWKVGHPLEFMLAVPAYKPALQQWNATSGLDTRVVSQLLDEVYNRR